MTGKGDGFVRSSGGPTRPSQPMQRRPGRERIEAQVHVYFGYFAKGGSAWCLTALPGRPVPGAACWHCGLTPLSYMLHPPPLTCVGHLFEFR